MINGRQFTFTIVLKMEPNMNIYLHTHLCEIPLQDVTGLQEPACSIRAIREAMYLCEFASPCIGREIPIDVLTSYKTSVSESKVLSVTSREREHFRLISNSCLLFNPFGKSCSSCQYAVALFLKRNRKRKATDLTCTPSKKCNMRYLSRAGLEVKIASQRKELRNNAKRAQESAMLEFTVEDNLDLATIFEGIDSADVPLNMQLLWEMQRKQLLAKSYPGHRWDPRYHFVTPCDIFSASYLQLP